MKWYWAITLYLVGLLIGIGCMILSYKLIKDEKTGNTKKTCTKKKTLN